MHKQLTRSRKDKMIAGVCGGLGEYLDIDPVFLRVAFVALAFLNGVGILAYIILAIVTPEEKSAAKLSTERADAERDASGLGDTLSEDTLSELETDSTDYFGVSNYEARRGRGRAFLAIGLIALGFVFLISNLGLLWWVNFDLFWPLVLVAIGLLLLFGQIRR